jgi:uncharacterized membrane-anchored protein YhcB (DUF1043 family)
MKYFIIIIISLTIGVIIGRIKKKTKKITITMEKQLEKIIPVNDDTKRNNLAKFGTECEPPD